MSPRTGRPKSENPKDISIKIRFDKDLYEMLISYCNEFNITRTEAIRRGVLLLVSRKK